MGVKQLLGALSGCTLLALDTMVFSYHLSNRPRYVALTSSVLGEIEAGRLQGLATTVSLAEVLTAAAQANDNRAMQDYEIYVTHFPHLRLVPLDIEVARETARVRAAFRMRTPDAVQVAAARIHGADAILTNDLRWKNRVDRPAVLLLDDYVD